MSRCCVTDARQAATILSVLERAELLTEVGRCKQVKSSRSLVHSGAGGREQGGFMDESRCSHHLMDDENVAQRLSYGCAASLPACLLMEARVTALVLGASRHLTITFEMRLVPATTLGTITSP